MPEHAFLVIPFVGVHDTRRLCGGKPLLAAMAAFASIEDHLLGNFSLSGRP